MSSNPEIGQRPTLARWIANAQPQVLGRANRLDGDFRAEVDHASP
jgi:hypothetical protein